MKVKAPALGHRGSCFPTRQPGSENQAAKDKQGAWTPCHWRATSSLKVGEEELVLRTSHPVAEVACLDEGGGQDGPAWPFLVP